MEMISIDVGPEWPSIMATLLRWRTHLTQTKIHLLLTASLIIFNLSLISLVRSYGKSGSQTGVVSLIDRVDASSFPGNFPKTSMLKYILLILRICYFDSIVFILSPFPCTRERRRRSGGRGCISVYVPAQIQFVSEDINHFKDTVCLNVAKWI